MEVMRTLSPEQQQQVAQRAQQELQQVSEKILGPQVSDPNPNLKTSEKLQ